MGYMVFLIIGIIGYTTVPSIANHIMWVGGGDALTTKTTAAAGMAAGAVANTAMTAGSAGMRMAGNGLSAAGDSMQAGLTNLYNAPGNIKEGYNQDSSGKGIGASAGRAYGYLRDKLKGGDSS